MIGYLPDLELRKSIVVRQQSRGKPTRVMETDVVYRNLMGWTMYDLL